MTETLKDLITARAAQDSYFMASVIAVWQEARPNVDVSEFLGCKPDDLWRLALAPRPQGAEIDLHSGAKRIADAFSVSPLALISMLRLFDSMAAFQSPSTNDQELLMAARDRLSKAKEPPH